MTPKLAQAVDPVFLHMLGLLDRIQRGEIASPQEERLRLRTLIDQAEAIVGVGGEWELMKYALVSWIDELLVESQWAGHDWWSNNVLEVELFNTRLCYEHFFVKAQEASTMATRDALEVYYVCVILGFRGVYRDSNMASHLHQSRGLPIDISSWAKQTSMAIRLGQGRPPLAGPQREIAGAPPLRGKGRLLWSALAAVILAASNVVVFYYQQ